MIQTSFFSKASWVIKQNLWKGLCLLVLCFPSSLYAELEDFRLVPHNRQFYFAEEFYNLYRENLYEKTDNYLANIFWLEHALKAPFQSPIKALAVIHSEEEWKQYRVLFYSELHFLIMENYIRVAEQWDKPHLFFFNQPWLSDLKTGFEMARVYYQKAEFHWQEFLKLVPVALENSHVTPRSLYGEMDKWLNRIFLVDSKDPALNYTRELKFRLESIEKKLKDIANTLEEE